MYLNVNDGYANFDSKLAKEEKNDCFVRSLAVASGSSYEATHRFAKEVFGREDKKGTEGFAIYANMLNFEEQGMTIGDVKCEVEVLGKARIKNQYKLKGEIILRQKTISSFIKDNPKGSFVVSVANHALAIKDGEVFDWDNNKFKPSRKVQSAYEVTSTKVNTQLELF